MEKAGNREYKSSVFTMLLKEKDNALDVFNALNGTDYKSEEDLEIRMLENAIYLSYRNDASFQEQTSHNWNFVVRLLI